MVIAFTPNPLKAVGRGHRDGPSIRGTHRSAREDGVAQPTHPLAEGTDSSQLFIESHRTKPAEHRHRLERPGRCGHWQSAIEQARTNHAAIRRRPTPIRRCSAPFATTSISVLRLSAVLAEAQQDERALEPLLRRLGPPPLERADDRLHANAIVSSGWRSRARSWLSARPAPPARTMPLPKRS